MSYQDVRASISASDALSKAWVAVKSNVWLFMGFLVVYFIAIGLLQMIPFIGSFSSLISFIFPVSLYSAFQAIDRTGSLSFNDFFSWTPKFARLLGANIVMLIIAIIVFLPLVFLFFASISTASILELFRDPTFLAQQIFDMSTSAILLVALLSFAVGFLFYIFNFAYIFLIQFKNLTIGESLKLSWNVGVKNIGQLVLFIFITIGVALLGMLALFIGLLVALPVITGMQYYFLKSIFPDEKAEEWDFMMEEVTTGL